MHGQFIPRRGIPTLYRGVQYRSRLEARWAAFFDLLGWPHQYEPFDLEGWIPDFLLTGRHPTLVEVKPVVELPPGLVAEINGCRGADEYEVLIAGCSLPVRCPRYSTYSEYESVTWEYSDGFPFGWLRTNLHRERHRDLNWGTAILNRWTDDGPIGLYHEWDRVRWDIANDCGLRGVEVDRISGREGDTIFWSVGTPDAPVIEPLWNQSGNIVQWRGKQSVVVS